jgi:metal-responsive CopG/Arc/MetJ family transcriptional regulator
LKRHLGVTIDPEIRRELEQLRGGEKRSTFVERIIRLGLEEYKRSKDKRD